jgi:hypothetical protein
VKRICDTLGVITLAITCGRAQCASDRFVVVAETEHAVAAVVVHHGAFQRDDPRTARSGRQVRIDRIVRVEIDETGQRLSAVRIRRA